MPAYIIADEDITDQAAFDLYKSQVLSLILKHGGRFLSRGGTATALETGEGWTPGRMVIIESPGMEALRARYDDPDYAPVLAIRLGAAKTTLVALVSGSA